MPLFRLLVVCQVFSPCGTGRGQKSTSKENLPFPLGEASLQFQLFTRPDDVDMAFALTPFQDTVEIEKLPVIPLSNPLVAGLIRECEWDKPLSDQVAAVDASERFGDDRSDPKLLGSQDGMFPAGVLTVVVASDNEASTPVPCPAGKLWVQPPENEVSHCLDVRAERHDDDAIRREVAGRDIVADHDQDTSRQLLRQRRLWRWWNEVRAMEHLHTLGLVQWWGKQEVPVVGSHIGQRSGWQRRLLAQFSRIGNDTA